MRSTFGPILSIVISVILTASALASAGCGGASSDPDAGDLDDAHVDVPADAGGDAGIDGGADGGGGDVACDDGNPCTVDERDGDTCTHVAGNAGTQCRSASGECDAPEVCDGTRAECPADAVAPATTTCRAQAGPCDVAELCDGVSTTCPDDALAPDTFVCRAAGPGVCDPAETCTGTEVECPADTGATRGTLLGASGGATLSNLYVIRPDDGVTVSNIGPIGFAVDGMAVDPNTRILYGVTSALSPASPNNLITINASSGAGTVVGSLGKRVTDISFASDGSLYGWTDTSDDLVIIDITTGAATVVGESTLGTSENTGLAFGPDGRLFLTGNGEAGDLRTVNVSTGLTTRVATLDGQSFWGISALAFDGMGVLYGGSIPAVSGEIPRLVTIDTATAAVTQRGPTGPRLDAIAFVCP